MGASVGAWTAGIGYWFAHLNYGDVPTWLGALAPIALALLAFLQRNRIAGFVRRKQKEPLPELPPVRWLPHTGNGMGSPGGGELDVRAENTSKQTAYNVRAEPTAPWMVFLDAAFADEVGPGESFRTRVRYRSQPDQSQSFTVGVRWQDANHHDHSEVLWFQDPFA